MCFYILPFEKEVVTGRDGTVTLTNLEASTYSVTELDPPEDYQIDNPGPQYVVLPDSNGETVVVTFTDTPIITSEAVSYTHLDVYKRQVEHRVASEDCYNTRAYFSLGKILEYVWEDCQGNSPATPNFEFFRGFSPRAGPAEQDDGGIEYGRFEGIPLW